MSYKIILKAWDSSEAITVQYILWEQDVELWGTENSTSSQQLKESAGEKSLFVTITPTDMCLYDLTIFSRVCFVCLINILFF